MSFPETVDEILDVSEDEGKVWDLTKTWVESGGTWVELGDTRALPVTRRCPLKFCGSGLKPERMAS